MENLKEPLIQVVADIPFFDCFDNAEIGLLLGAGTWMKVAPGDRIITKGEIDLRMFVLIQGHAEVVLHDKVLAVLNIGDIFGEFGLMGAPRMAHVEAQTDCLLLSFDADQLNDLPLELQVKFLRRILLAIFARLQKINQWDWLRRHAKKDS
jgi:eukaryotic-like serine/threonine-protein kinase